MPVDLQAYGERIEYAGEFTPTLSTLCDLHLAHATHIPFENLDILLGRPIRLDLESIAAKLIEGRRAGIVLSRTHCLPRCWKRSVFA
jgi:N-hydroxyarylamine O-acetyltransferase